MYILIAMSELTLGGILCERTVRQIMFFLPRRTSWKFAIHIFQKKNVAIMLQFCFVYWRYFLRWLVLHLQSEDFWFLMVPHSISLKGDTTFYRSRVGFPPHPFRFSCEVGHVMCAWGQDLFVCHRIEWGVLSPQLVKKINCSEVVVWVGSHGFRSHSLLVIRKTGFFGVVSQTATAWQIFILFLGSTPWMRFNVKRYTQCIGFGILIIFSIHTFFYGDQ